MNLLLCQCLQQKNKDLHYHQFTIICGEHMNCELHVRKNCGFPSVDEFCKSINIDHIHFLKIDLEGHELAVLQGAKNMLKERKIDYIQFEFGVAHIEAKTFIFDFWRILCDNYQIYRIVSGGLIPLNRYAEQMEIFLYSNYLAELK